MAAIMLGEAKYVSSKEAAEITGYTQDYVGQLARGGQIDAKRVSGMWYINEESLKAYKTKADEFVPTPPQGIPARHDAETAVSFDGKDYISTARASKLTGYNQDYVGQLARSGEILSRQVGNRWYVDRESLLAHKQEKDALLAAVQVESVGLAKPGEEVANNMQQESEQTEVAVADVQDESSEKSNENIESSDTQADEVTHFEYVEEKKVPLIPEIPAVEATETDPMPEFPRRKVSHPFFEEHRDAQSLQVEEKPTEPVVEAVTDDEKAPEVVPEEETTIPIRVRAPEIIEEHIYVEEGSVPEPTITVSNAPRAPKKGGTGTILALSGVAVAAAVGTIAYIGSALGVFDMSSVISRPQSVQNAAASNSFAENGSRFIPESIRSLFSKELIYERQ